MNADDGNGTAADLMDYVRLGRTLGSENEQIVVGRDSSARGPMIFNLIASGMVSMGCDVRSVGIAPTPTLALAAKGKGCGVMLCQQSTERLIDMKIWNRSGTQLDGSGVSALKALDAPELPSYESVGNIFEQSGAVPLHKGMIMKLLGEADCPVVLDCSSNCASLIAPSLLTEMGCDVIAINSQPGRSHSGPKGIEEADLRDLADIVNSNTGEVGIAINGDGTRIAAMDEGGRYIDGERILALFAQYLDPKKIVIPVTASMMVDDLIDGEVVRVAAGDAALGMGVLNSGADLGGSPSGSFIFPQVSLSPDGIYSSGLLSKIAGESRLRELVDTLPEYHMEHAAVKYDGDERDIAKKISEEVHAQEYQKLVETDGWRVEMDSGWYLIRFSGNEQVIRITTEARDALYAISLMDIARDIVNDSSK